MTVTVIIPIYNTEKYLERCIQSVCQQTFMDLEIILIDDGSEDSSRFICDHFAGKDKRIKVVHKENEGISAARNLGLEIAIGDYITFLDSDDYLSVDCIEKLLGLCKIHNAEIAIAKMVYVSEKTNSDIKSQSIENVIVLNNEEAIEASLYQVLYSCTAPGKLYKSSIIRDVKYPISRLSEDLATSHLILDKAKKIVYTNQSLYHYRQHESSIMHVFNPKRLDALDWTSEIEAYCKLRHPSILAAAKCRTFNVAVHLVLELPRNSEIHSLYFKRIWKEVKRTRLQIVFNRKARFREKAASLLSFCGERLLKRAWNSCFVIRQFEN